MKITINKPLQKVSFLLISILMLTLIGCSTPEEKATAYVEKGNEYLAEGNIEKAKIEFKNALQLKKTSVEAIYGLALVAEKEGNWQQEYALLSEVVLKQPQHLKAQVKIGGLLLAANELVKAEEVANKLNSIDKNNPEVLLFMAGYSLKKGDAAAAVDYSKKALEKDSKLADVYIVLASERLIAKDYTKAIEFLNNGIEKSKDNLGMRLMKVKIYEESNQNAKVETEYQQIIKLNPDVVGFRKMFAGYLLKQGRKEEAEAQFRKIAELQPKDTKAKLDVVGFINQTKGAQAARKELESQVSKDQSNYDLRFALFSLYDQLNDGIAAEKLLNEIIDDQKNEPNGLKAKGLLAIRMLKSNKKNEAIHLIDEVLEHDAKNEQALTLKAGLQIDNKEFDNAVANLRTVLRDNPNSVRTLLLLAKVHANTGDKALAEEHYLRAFKASNNQPSVGLEYVSYLLKGKQSERAEKIVQEILTIYPNDIATLKALAQIKVMSGDFAGAQEIANKLKSNSNTSVLGEQLTGAILYSQKNYDEGIAAYKRIYDSAPENTKSITDLAFSYLYAGKTKEAEALLKTKLASNPKSLELAAVLGQVYIRTGAYEQAIKHYKDMIQLHPNHSIGYRSLATLYINMKKNIEAQQVLNEGLVKVPNDPNLKLVQASLYETDKKYDEAIKTYEEIYSVQPDAIIVVNNLASLLSDHKTDKASLDKSYKLGLSLKGAESSYFKDTFAWSSYRVGKNDEALAVLNEITKSEPEVSIFQYHLGMVLKAKGDKVNAKQALEKALTLSKSGDGLPVDEVKQALSTL